MPSDTQTDLNAALESRFEGAMSQGQLAAFVAFADAQMPPLLSSEANPVRGELASDDRPLPALGVLECGDIKLTVSRELGIRAYYRGVQLTTDRENIPVYYPWFSPDPADTEQIAEFAARHVARGARADTWPESQWPLVDGVCQGEQNWPPRSVAFGPYQLGFLEDDAHKAISVALPPDAAGTIQPNAYGVIPRGLFLVAPDTSVLMAFQNENRSALGLHWSAWFILGFAMPSVPPSYTNPHTIFAFPDNLSEGPPVDHMTKIWNIAEIAGQRVALINPHVKTLNEPFKKLYADTNWAIIATQGQDTLILLRSMLRHEEQYFPFLEHGRHFIEAEFTGRRAAPGETSTVLVRQEILPLAQLTQNRIQQFSTQAPTFEQEVRELLALLIQDRRLNAIT